MDLKKNQIFSDDYVSYNQLEWEKSLAARIYNKNLL